MEVRNDEKDNHIPKGICLSFELVFVCPWHDIDVDDFVLCEFDHVCGNLSVGCVVVWLQQDCCLQCPSIRQLELG